MSTWRFSRVDWPMLFYRSLGSVLISTLLTGCSYMRTADMSYQQASVHEKPLRWGSSSATLKHGGLPASRGRIVSIRQDGESVLIVPVVRSKSTVQIPFDGSHLALKQFVPPDDRVPTKNQFFGTVFRKEKDNPSNYCPTWVEGSLFPYLQVISPNISPAWAYLQVRLASIANISVLSENHGTIRFLLETPGQAALHFFMEKKADMFYISYGDQDDDRQGRMRLKQIYQLLKARCR